MSLQSQPSTPAAANLPTAVMSAANGNLDESAFHNRRRSGAAPGVNERRQFGSSHVGLSDQGRELASAIDQYKVQHHRRYITCDEMLAVITELGYTQSRCP